MKTTRLIGLTIVLAAGVLAAGPVQAMPAAFTTGGDAVQAPIVRTAVVSRTVTRRGPFGAVVRRTVVRRRPAIVTRTIVR